MTRKEFSGKNKTKVLLWCDRHCCLCGKQAGGQIQIHHIEKENDNNINNAIPLCLECHGLVHAHNYTPIGNKFKPNELKIRRNQIYDKYTSYLVPILKFEVRQLDRKLPDIGFSISHTGCPFPIKAFTHLKVYLGGRLIKDFSRVKDYYGGNKPWHLNPGNGVDGHFQIPSNASNSKTQLKIKVAVKMVDVYEYEHHLLPVEFIYMRDKNEWYLEP